MKMSIKILHSRMDDFPMFADIHHRELVPRPGEPFVPEPEMSPDSSISVEFVSTARTVFANDHFNTIDIYSIHKDGTTFFNTSPIPWESDEVVSWTDYRRELVRYMACLFHQRLGSVSGLDEYYLFRMKYNLLESVRVGRYRGRYHKHLREAELLNRIASCRDDCRHLIDEALVVFTSYGHQPELKLRFLLDVLDVFPLSTVEEMVKGVGDVTRYQAVLLYYRLYSRCLATGRHRRAFLYATNASRLLKQGVNLDFEESMKSMSIDCIRESNWSVVLEDVMARIEAFDLMKYGLNPYRLRRPDTHRFVFRTAELEPTSIRKCTDDTVLFNRATPEIHFTDSFRLRVSFTQVSSAPLRGISGRVLSTGEEIFMPVHMTLTNSYNVVNVIADIPRLARTISDSDDEVEIGLENLVFSNTACESVDMRVVWTRRKSTVSVRALEHVDTEPGKVLMVLGVHSVDGFESRLIGPGVARRGKTSGCTVFEAVQDVDTTSQLHHEVSENVFETLRFIHP